MCYHASLSLLLLYLVERNVFEVEHSDSLGRESDHIVGKILGQGGLNDLAIVETLPLVPLLLHVGLRLHSGELCLFNVDATKLGALSICFVPEVLGKSSQINIGDGILEGCSLGVVKKISDVLNSHH